MPRIPFLLLLGASLTLCNPTFAADIDWAKVDEAIGRKGTEQPGRIHKFGLPRSDLTVVVDGVTIKPPLALGSWLAFQPADQGVMVMGDLVLTEREISPVMKRLIDKGFEISAIHNHLLRTSIPVFYMHIEAHGDAVQLATALHESLTLSGTPLSAPAAAPSMPLDFDTVAIENALGYKGAANGGVYQFVIPRAEEIRQEGMVIPPAMGTATAINFQPTGKGKAAITGDFVLTGGEVNPVLKVLRERGIEVTALHSHMIDESPRLYFMHFWATADGQQLAQALRAALDLTNVKPRS